MFAAFKRSWPPPTKWRWPGFWGFVAGLAIQTAFGIFPSLFSLIALIVADPQRCPVAVRPEGNKPFFAWALGVVVGNILCETMTTLKHTSNGSWVLWGGVQVLAWTWWNDLLSLQSYP